MENRYTISSFFLKVNEFIWKNSFVQRFRNIFYIVDFFVLLFCKKNNTTQETTNKKKVLIVYNMALGDGIIFSGVSNHIRKIWPKDEYEVTIACQSAFASLYKADDTFDHVIPLDFAGSILNLRKRREMYQKLRECSYDIIVDPVGCDDCTTNVFVTRAAIGAKKIGVMDKTRTIHEMPHWMRKKIYTQVVELDIPHMHLLEQYAAFWERLSGEKCELKLAQLPRAELKIDLPKDFFIVFPVASVDVKKWKPAHYAIIAKRIYDRTKFPLLVCGTEHDRPSIKEFLAELSDVPVIDAIGKTNILEYTELIGRARLILTNDTSAYHIAVARQVPTVMLCGGYVYDKYANYPCEKLDCQEPILATEPMECYNCANHCKYQGFSVYPCIEKITVEKVWSCTQQLIERIGL